jgi:hypothetical protein
MYPSQAFSERHLRPAKKVSLSVLMPVAQSGRGLRDQLNSSFRLTSLTILK